MLDVLIEAFMFVFMWLGIFLSFYFIIDIQHEINHIKNNIEILENKVDILKQLIEKYNDD